MTLNLDHNPGIEIDSSTVDTPPPPNGCTGIVDSDSIADEGGNPKAVTKVDGRKNNGRKKGTKNLKTIAKEAIVDDEFYKIARRKTGGVKDVFEMLFAKAVGEGDLVAAKIIMDKVMPNAQVEKENKITDFGITINISDMKSVEIKEVEGEVIDA